MTPNAEIVYETLHDDALREIICKADLILPDGAGVVLASKMLGTPLKEKVAGIDFIEHLMKTLEHTDRSFYFLGSKPGVAEAAADKLHEKYPELTICGMADGYFKEDGPVIAAINEKKPDVLLGLPWFTETGTVYVEPQRGIGCWADGWPWRQSRWLCRECKACAQVDDTLQSGMALSAASGAKANRAHDASSKIPLACGPSADERMIPWES